MEERSRDSEAGFEVARQQQAHLSVLGKHEHPFVSIEDRIYEFIKALELA